MKCSLKCISQIYFKFVLLCQLKFYLQLVIEQEKTKTQDLLVVSFTASVTVETQEY